MVELAQDKTQWKRFVVYKWDDLCQRFRFQWFNNTELVPKTHASTFDMISGTISRCLFTFENLPLRATVPISNPLAGLSTCVCLFPIEFPILCFIFRPVGDSLTIDSLWLKLGLLLWSYGVDSWCIIHFSYFILFCICIFSILQQMWLQREFWPWLA